MQRLGLIANPADLQPTTGTKILSAIAGPRAEERAIKANQRRVGEIARQDMGLPVEESLAGKGAFDRAEAAAAAPYNEVRSIPRIDATPESVAALEALRPSESIIGSKLLRNRADKLIDEAVVKLQSGMSGENLLDNIRSLRQKASKIYQNDNASPEQIDMANVYRGMAKTLEQAIDNGITDPDLLRRFQSARTQLAKIHDYRDATNFNTGIVDAAKIAKITAGDNSQIGRAHV